jgi:hypothetical protein
MPAIRPLASKQRKRRTDSQRGAPIAFYAEAAIQPGEFATLNVDALRNNTASYVEINEIRFYGHAVNTVTAVGRNIGPGFIDVDLKLGDVKLTNNPVSSALLARAEGGVWVVPPPSTYTGAVTSFARLKLARPIVLAPGQMIEPTVYHRGGVAFPLDVRVAMVGRALSARPLDQMWLPYIASYHKTVQLDTTNPIVIVSNEKNLVNSTLRNVRIERMTGRFAEFQTQTIGATQYSDMIEPTRVHGTGAIYADTKVRLTDSRGFNFALDQPMASIFDPSRCGWENRFNLQPGGFVIAEITVPPSATVNYVQVGVGLIGYREI